MKLSDWLKEFNLPQPEPGDEVAEQAEKIDLIPNALGIKVVTDHDEAWLVFQALIEASERRKQGK